ncbi:MAG: tetratricopeptide repeat protein [Elainella sp. Prado103]|nr:tetratricopeptide repeat protein [Elainella sp. Prado103]
MDSLSFGIWFGVIGLIAAIGLGSMISAYWGKGSVAVVFPEPLWSLVPVKSAESTELQLSGESSEESSGESSGAAEAAASIPSSDPPVAISDTPELASVALFRAGCEAFQAGQYRRAIDQFTQALQQEPDWAAAYHNRGRATANLRRVPEGVADLVKAGDLYLQQGKAIELEQIKQDLAQLKAMKAGSN